MRYLYGELAYLLELWDRIVIVLSQKQTKKITKTKKPPSVVLRETVDDGVLDIVYFLVLEI